MNIPLVSEYKIHFITQRLIQTFFGGFDYKFNNLGVSSHITTLIKIILYIYPFFIGLIFTIIVELNCLTEYLAAIISGAISITIMI